MIKILFVCILSLYNLSLVESAYQTPIATLNDCPTKAFTRVSNGCYFFQNQTGTTWENAKEACKGMITSDSNSTESSVSHLLIIDTLGEAIALSFWFKGNNYNKTYWIGGYFDTENSLWKWEWNGLPYVKNSYISENNIGTNPKMYLEFNSTNQYEYRSSNGLNSFNYICEAQVPCQSEVSTACQNGGSCYVNVGRVYCACPPGYTGIQCEMQIDNCINLPCLHGGDCNNLVNNYTCNCTQYFSGFNCEIENPDPLENLRNWVFYLCVSISLFFLGLLCMLDLPWIQIISIFRKMFPTQAEKEIKRAADRVVIPEYKEPENEKKKKKADLIKAEVLLNSEEEMLKRFRMALIQNNSRAVGPKSVKTDVKSTSPTDLEINSRLSKRNFQTNHY